MRCFDAEIFAISDETDCKTSSRAVAELEGSEWQADKLYIILGKICYGTNHRGEWELSMISICKGLEGIQSRTEIMSNTMPFCMEL